MERVIIIGGGFGGIAAAMRLSHSAKDFEIVLIDKGDGLNFRSMLPDVIAKGLDPGLLFYPFEEFRKKIGFRHVRETVKSVDLAGRTVSTETSVLPYDYLIIASGTEPTFFGREDIRRAAFTLHTCDDARRLRKALESNDRDTVVIVGGGYTGIETATSVRVFLNERGRANRVIVADIAPTILAALPEKIREYTAQNLRTLNIEVKSKTSVAEVAHDRLILSSGETIGDALLIWTAGVRTADFVAQLPIEKSKQGRLKVDDYLRIGFSLKLQPEGERCYAIGDVAQVMHNDHPLRMAVQFSISEGLCAAENVIRCRQDRPLRPYRPRDLGYVVPIANGRSCGIVLGVAVLGFMPTFLHYLMCVARSYRTRNRLGILWLLARRAAGSRG